MSMDSLGSYSEDLSVNVFKIPTLDIVWLDFANLDMALPWTQTGRFPDPAVDLMRTN